MTRAHAVGCPNSLYIDVSTRDKIIEANRQCIDMLKRIVDEPGDWLDTGAVVIETILSAVNTTLEALQ